MGVEAWLILVVGVLGAWLLLAMGVEVWMLLMVGVLGSWAYTRKQHNYWSARGVSTPPYLPFLGHMHKLFSLTQSKWVYFWEVYRKYGGDKFCGLYEMHNPVLFIRDPHLIKLICVKDFEHFVNRRDIGIFHKNSVVNNMLFNKMGSEWKALRSVMTPTFTSGKMRGMFPLICDKADALVSSSLKQCAEKSYADMKYNFGSFTIETIASCAFGIDCDSKGDENINFAKQAYNISAFSLTYLMQLAITRTVPTLSHALGLNKERPEFLFFKSVAEKAIQLRRGGQRRGDFLDLLIEAQVAEDSFIKNNHTTVNKDHTTLNNDHTTLTNNHTTLNNDHTQTPSKGVLDDDTIIAQSVLFLLAGYDTMASTLTFTSFLLAKNPTHQQRLRRELQDLVQVHGDVTYQVIMDAKFLEACIMEALRLYPPVPTIERRCTKDYRLPGTEVIIRAGDMVVIPTWSLHHDARYWPDPEQFQPERFLPKNKATTATHLPFGIGPRICIAHRFAMMEAKITLTKMLLAAVLSLPEGQEHMELATSSSLMRPRYSVNMILTPVTHSPDSLQ